MLAGPLLALHACLAWAARVPGVRTGEDEAIYVLLARSLRHGQYVNSFQVGQPPHGMYPPGYPALLALWSFLGSNADWLIALSTVSSVVAIALVYDACRRRYDAMLSFGLLAALALNPYLVSAGGHLYSEATFIALSIGALWATTRDTPASAWLASALGIGAALTRSAGVTLLPAIALVLLLKRRFLPFGVFIAVSAGTVGLWQLHTLRQPAQYVGRSYVADFEEAGPQATESPVTRLTARVAANARSYARDFPYLLPIPTISGTPVDNVLGALVAIGGIAVGLFVVVRWWPAAVVYLLCYGALLAIWPWPVPRFVIPLIPLLLVALVAGWDAMGHRLRPALGTGFGLAVLAVLVVNGLLRTTALVADASGCEHGHSPPDASCVSVTQVGYFEATQYLRDSVPADAVVLSAKPATVYYYARRRGIQRPVTALPPADSLIAFLKDQGVSYVLLGSVHWSETTRLGPALSEICRSLSLRKAIPPFTYVFALAADTASGEACEALRRYRAVNRGQRFAAPP